MARLRQTFANRYASSEATGSEFENIVRYINAAEIGNLTLHELMEKLFDAEGDLSLGLRMRFNPGVGLEYQIGDETENWTLVAAEDAVRGAPGVDIGTVEAPLFANRVYHTGNGSQTVFSYDIPNDTTDILVWVNGILQAESAYSYTAPGTSVTMVTAPPNAASVLIAGIRTSASAIYERIDYISADGQVTFPFPHSDADELIVFVNGVFKREGGGFDYVRSSASGTINFTVPRTVGSLVTIMNVANRNIQSVTGLMLEERYTSNGLLRLDKIAIANDAIAQTKVNGLVAALALRADVYVQPTTPVSPRSGSLWVQTGGLLPSLAFFDGTRWVSTNAEGLIPSPTNANALQFLRLNSSANAFEYASFDASGFILTSRIGASGGVAPLDGGGLLPSSVIPAFLAVRPINVLRSGALANGTFKIALIANSGVTVRGIAVELGAGSATIQLRIDGVDVGSPVAATTTPTRVAISNHVVNALTSPKSVALVVSGASSASDLIVSVETLATS
jgi:hypothetical protein